MMVDVHACVFVLFDRDIYYPFTSLGEIKIDWTLRLSITRGGLFNIDSCHKKDRFNAFFF
jgi:hypothetical protein